MKGASGNLLKKRKIPAKKRVRDTRCTPHILRPAALEGSQHRLAVTLAEPDILPGEKALFFRPRGPVS
jgi:hypothetical protein